MSACIHPRRLAPAILNPRIDGWRSEDGYALAIRRGAFSKRPIGELTTPGGERHIVAGARRDTAADVLDRAEAAIRQHRASGRAT